jgi:hypothetical protein
MYSSGAGIIEESLGMESSANGGGVNLLFDSGEVSGLATENTGALPVWGEGDVQPLFGGGHRDEDGNDVSEGSGDETGSSGLGAGTLELMEAPRLAEKVDIGFATFAKKVDMSALKRGMWQVLQQERAPAKPTPACTDQVNSIDDQKARVPGESFQEVVVNLGSALGAHTLRHVSVPYCFITLLHLANEKGLSLSPMHAHRGFELQAIDAVNAPDALGQQLHQQRDKYLGNFVIKVL